MFTLHTNDYFEVINNNNYYYISIIIISSIYLFTNYFKNLMVTSWHQNVHIC